MTNALDILDNRYPGMAANGYKREDVIIGAPYLITRDWTDGQAIIARQRASHSKDLIFHEGNNWYATLINPPVKVGDKIFGLERGDGKDSVLRKDRRRTVTAVSDDGVLAKYSTYDAIPITHWVMAEDPKPDPTKDRHNPERRKLVLDRLSKEGMNRIGDTGYAVSAAEFFKHFDLPRPDVQPTAVLDVEREMDHNGMPRDLRYLLDEAGVTSLRKATITGRAKVKLDKSQCRCKEITQEEAVRAWRHAGNWKIVKVHKVECLWCTEIARVENGEF